MSFNIGDRVVYVGGDAQAFCEPGEAGVVSGEYRHEFVDEDAVEVRFDSLHVLGGKPGTQVVLADCLTPEA